MFNDSQLIEGRYRILQQIAEGDLGAIYMATDMETGGLCALQPIALPSEANLDEVQEEVRQEAERIQALDHPNIAPPGVLRGRQEPFLVRDFIEGKPLDELLRWEAPLTLGRACSLAKQIAMALEAAHHAGIIHGDLKPANILLTDNDGEETARVLGFSTLPLKKGRFINLAHLAVEDGSGRLFGTPEYISPEQAMGQNPEALDGRSDLYSLGVILYQMLAGELPFEGKSPMEVLLAQIFTEPRPLASQPGIEAPLALDTLLMRMLGKKRADRPASATAIIDQLTPWEERRAPVKQASKQPVGEPEPAQPLRAEAARELAPEPPQEIPQPVKEAQEAPFATREATGELPSAAASFASPAPSAEGAASHWEIPVAATSVFASPFSAAPPPLAEETDERVHVPAASPPPPEQLEPLGLESFDLSEPEPSEPLPEQVERAQKGGLAEQAELTKPPTWATPATQIPEAPAMDDAFLSGLIPAADHKIVEPPPTRPLDIHLNAGEHAPEAAARRSHHGPVLLGNYPAKPPDPSVLYTAPPESKRTWLKALATVALLIVILGGAGCGWLYLTGRTYWFNPQFLKTKVSYYLSSGSTDASPQTETVNQPSDQSPPTPVNTAKAAPPAQSQPGPAAVTTPPSSNSAQPPATASGASASAPTQQGQTAQHVQSTPAQQQTAQQAQSTPQATPLVGGASDAAASKRPQGPQASGKTQALKAHNGTNAASALDAQARAHSRAESAAVADAITRGEYYFDRGDYDAAIQVYEESLAQYPSNAQLADEIARARRAKAAESKYLR
ncbi:MAG TPA: protein kinase [Terriglobia bacterium]|nr:protein kinase [Terriglobia bacterium]